MPQSLKQNLDPWRCAEREQILNTENRLSDFKRLGAVLLNTEGTVKAHLEFGFDTERNILLQGHAATVVNLECQRCLNTVAVNINAKFLIAFVRNSRKIDELSETCDAIELADDELVSLLDIIEDELLLSLPLVAKHNEADCVIRTEFGDKNAEISDTTASENPFAVLASLKQSVRQKN